MSTSPLSYIILVVDVRPSLQQHLHNGEMPFLRGKDKGRVSFLHHIFIEKKLRYSVQQIICPIELKNWKINCASHQYSDASPISGSLME